MNNRIEAIREIDVGENVCKLIKKMYFHDTHWSQCYRQVADKFTMMKKILRRFYGLEKKDLTTDIWEKIEKYTEKDIEEVFLLEDDFMESKAPSQGKLKKYTDNVVWVPVPTNKPEVLAKVRGLLTKDDNALDAPIEG